VATLAILVVTYNSRRDIDACLQALADAHIEVSHEVVVIDNASADGTAGHVRSHWPHVRVIESRDNVGFAAGNNLGIRATRTDLVLLLNPDTRVSPGAVDALAAALGAHPGAAVCGPRIVDGSGRAELSFGRMISPINELRQKLLMIGLTRGVPAVVRHVERITRVPRRVDWVSGACLLIRRPDLEAAGLLDERYFMYTEDVDLCAAVRAAGRSVLFVPEAEVVHLRGRSAETARPATQAAYHRSHVAFYRKHHPRWAPVLELYLRARGR
jgi:N-acetylglucosaminyl-diphospho-decaprenol L-rhamnosyltransferase